MFRKLLLFFVLGASFISNAQINLVKDFYEGSGKNGNPFFYGVFKDKLIFNANTTLINIESYSYDGTTVENITDSNGNIVKITPIYFPDEGADDPMIITMLESSVLKTFKYDGTNFSKISDNRAMGGGIKFNGKYYFTAEIGSKYPLCFTDLTEGGTGFLKEDAKTFVNWNNNERDVVKKTLVFVADNYEEGIEFWKTDGTEDGTTILKEIYKGS